MEDLYQVGDDQIERYADYYLLKPIELCMRLKQVTQQDMLIPPEESIRQHRASA